MACPFCPVTATAKDGANGGWPGPVPQDPDSWKIRTPTITPTPEPNNSTSSQQPNPLPKVLRVRIAVGGDPSAFTPQTLEWYRRLGVTEIHIVPSDYYTYPELASLIKSFGMYPVVDVEITQWAGMGFSIHNSGDASRDYFAGLRDAGWVAIASEGLSDECVATIQQFLPFISYGGDDGVNLYESSYYHHDYNSHAANYQEIYYSEYYSQYRDTLNFGAKLTPKNFGVTIGLWGWSSQRPATMSMNPSMIEALLRDLYQQGNDLNGMTFLFWTGAGFNPALYLASDPYGYGGDFVPTLQFVQSLNGRQYTAPMVAS